MAIVANHLTTNVDNTNNTSVNTASITPTGNALVLAFIRQHRQDGGTPTAPTASGNGLTWVQVATRQLTADSSHRVTLFRAMGASPSGGVVTFSFSENTDERSWTIVEFTGVDTSGTNGSGAVVQSAADDSAGTPLTITLSAFADTNNATYGAMGTNVGSTISVGTGFTQIGTTASAGAVQSQWKSTNDTSVDWTFTGGSFGGGIAAEIKIAPVVTVSGDSIAYFM